MEFSSNEFESIINLAEERSRDTGKPADFNASPKRRDFPDFGISSKDRSKFEAICEDTDVLSNNSKHFTCFVSLPDYLEDPGFFLRDAVEQSKYVEESRIAKQPTGTPNVRIVNGQDIGDLPIEYRIEGLADHELPVKGFYVDKSVIPGFHYTVRYNGTRTRLFGGQPRLLKSVGKGYGKRLTFAGENPNDAVCFWSDSNEDGYAFGIHAVGEGDEFVICDETLRPLGRAFVISILLPQQLISTSATGGDVTMRVKVAMSVVAEYNLERHGMLPLTGGESAVVEGVAVVEKRCRQRKAMTVRIEQVVLPKIGLCTLRAEI